MLHAMLQTPPDECEVAALLDAVSVGPGKLSGILRRLIFQRDVLLERRTQLAAEAEAAYDRWAEKELGRKGLFFVWLEGWIQSRAALGVLLRAECPTCGGSGRQHCPRCSGEGCSPHSVAANGPCLADKPCPACKGVPLRAGEGERCEDLR